MPLYYYIYTITLYVTTKIYRYILLHYLNNYSYNFSIEIIKYAIFLNTYSNMFLFIYFQDDAINSFDSKPTKTWLS